MGFHWKVWNVFLSHGLLMTWRPGYVYMAFKINPGDAPPPPPPWVAHLEGWPIQVREALSVQRWRRFPSPPPLHCTFRRLFHTVTSIAIKGGTVRSNAHVDCFFNALPEPSTNQGHGTEHNMIMVVMSTQDILLHHSFDAHLDHVPSIRPTHI